MRLTRRQDTVVLDLVEEAGRNAQRASLMLRELLVELPERSDLARDLYLCEQEGDRIAHDVILHLRARRRRRAPFDAAEGHELAATLDDIVDYAEESAAALVTHRVEAPMEQSVALADVLVGATQQVAEALRNLRTGSDLTAHLVEIHRLENEGDRLSREAIASLFANGIDPMVIIRWKDVFESLEASVDACERVAHVLEGIALRRR
jgi:uncharacterized protein Yka (UPF0111/DUF47 family)